MSNNNLVIALSGGVGGSKLALGLSNIVEPSALMIVANTGDDFEHLDLHISPDIDTVTYTLSRLNNPETGWGQRDETWNFMATLRHLGGASWFQLGDRDLAIHVERTRRLRAGESLSAITKDFALRLGIHPLIVPMSNDKIRTRVRTDDCWLDFQEYFVRDRCEPIVRELQFVGSDIAEPHPDFLAALSSSELRAVILCPSNPFISIDPILSLPRVRSALRNCRAPVIAVSPIVDGKSIKGPTSKLMQELGHEISAASIAEYYSDFLDGYVVDHSDEGIASRLKIPVALAKGLMITEEDKNALAQAALSLADAISGSKA